MSWMPKPQRSVAGLGAACIALSVAPLVPRAEASVTISSGATENMSCSGGVCSPTKANAVLNSSSLESMLAAGNVTVTSTGSGSVQANDIVVGAALTWRSSDSLTLSAKQSIAFDANLSVTGKGGLTLNDAGEESLAFNNAASVSFSKLASSLVINGNSYVLVNTVAGFASAVSSNQNGFFALAANYNAASDGTYPSAPVQGNNATGGMNGIFEGLGHSISNLTIVDGTQSAGCDGLISNAPQETISNFGMVNFSITSTGDQGANYAGGIVCNNNTNGLIWRSYATGEISMGRLDAAGGLEFGGGLIVQSWANVAISGGQGSAFGGLTTGTAGIDQSFFMGSVSCTGGSCQLGGLALGLSQGGTITNSYSVATVTDGGPGTDDSYVGGLLSQTGGNTVEQSYAAGKITTPDSGCANDTDCVGGLFGIENGNDNKQAYWDTTKTGIGAAAGNESSDPGTKGLGNRIFIAKLPKGFSKKIWAESPSINNGLPYLIANPPPS
jgi:hypothetical protein